MILAALLLKVGGYGFLRILLPIFPNATEYFAPMVIALCTMSVIFTSFATLRQVDIKRIIAYSSIAHMNIAIIGIFNLSAASISGGVALMFGHGIVSGGLFFIVGILYERHKTKIISYYSGIVHGMPLLSTFFFMFILGNISMPSTCNFVGEFIILHEIVSSANTGCLIAMCISIFCCTIYSLVMFNRITFGLPRSGVVYKDLTQLEAYIVFVVTLYNIYYGIYPKPVIELFETTCKYSFDL